ncbi:deoxyribonuclease II [Scenedesmus sp. NREL 46B-D3]|nr:deoxyribonuclease II [Scenedesmus sp. NREL 46B-D3]
MGPVAATMVTVGLIYAGVVAAVSTTQQQQGTAAMQQQQQAVCLGFGRKPVDWWIMLKHPAGYQYSYLDSSILGDSSSSTGGCPGGSCWRHRLSMLNPNPVAHTLAALAAAAVRHQHAASQAAAAQELAYAVYNDADPAGVEHFEFAHAKGVAAFSSSNSISGGSGFLGFWLVHSAPRFPQHPSLPGFDQLNRSQAVFGQHFSCLSLAGAESVHAVAQLLLVAGPYIYSSRLPGAAAAAFPAWQQLLAGGSDQQQHSLRAALQTPGQQQLLGFAKTKFLVEQLTDAVVGPGLGSSMLWETWRRSHDALPSECGQDPGQLSSLNVQLVAFPGTPYRWPWSMDHSKWGVSVQGGNSSSSSSSGMNGENVVCLGDMNRAAWQAHRGGGYVCMHHQGLWQAFSSIVAAVEQCARQA